MNLDAQYVVHELPPKIATILDELMDRLGLVYDTIDLRLTPDGHYVFLEINPAGQFLYIEHATGQPIAAALVETLVKKPGGGGKQILRNSVVLYSSIRGGLTKGKHYRRSIMGETRQIQPGHLNGTVRITLPAAVASNLASFQKSIGALVERLGCPTCFSGADCTFTVERDFLMNERLEISPSTPIVSSPDPDGDPTHRRRGVRVHMASDVSHNLEGIQTAVAKIAERLGHPMCCSGFDIAFREEVNVITVDRDLNVQAFGSPR